MLDETNYKAHFRRGVCRAGLGRKEDAKEGKSHGTRTLLPFEIA